MYKCPHPGCDHVSAYIILNSHAKTHGFNNMKELSKVHGKVEKLSASPKALKWAKNESVNITSGHYDGIEAAVSRLVNRKNARNR